MTANTNNKIGLRLGLTVGLGIVWAATVASLHSLAPLISGNLAPQQLQNSNTAYLASQTSGLFTGTGSWATLIALALLLWVWFKPVKNAFKGAGTVAALALIFGTTTFMVPSAHAYFSVKDNEENIEILPNQSAFLIPEVGANETNQAAFMSKDYLEHKKVAQKRINIPHTTMHMAGVFNKDFFIPSARLTIVDRTPFYREWTASTTSGTSAKDESFPFEDGNSINISTGIAIAAHVTEENSPLYLYSVGTNPNHKPYVNPGDPDDADLTPQERAVAAQFASVIYGQDLATVMDTVIRGKVEAVLAREYGNRALLNIIGEKPEKAEIIAIVEKEVTAFAATYGITIDFIGYAGSLTYDKPVQDAINTVFIAKLQSQHLKELQDTINIKSQYTNIDIKAGIAKATEKWNGQLPSVSVPSIIWIPNNLLDKIEGWLGLNTPPVTTPTATPSK